VYAGEQPVSRCRVVALSILLLLFLSGWVALGAYSDDEAIRDSLPDTRADSEPALSDIQVAEVVKALSPLVDVAQIATDADGVTVIRVIGDVPASVSEVVQGLPIRMIGVQGAAFSLQDQRIYEEAIREVLAEMEVTTERVIGGPRRFLILVEEPPLCEPFSSRLADALRLRDGVLTETAGNRIAPSGIGEDISFFTDPDTTAVMGNNQPCR